MELGQAKKLIKKAIKDHSTFVNGCSRADNYYKNKNDILNKKPRESVSALRNADNRIPFGFFNLLVDQKVSYLFTYPPTFDVKDEKLNDMIYNVLGDDYPKKIKDLGVDSSVCGISWLHYWNDKDDGFQYAVVPPQQIVPIYNKKLNKKLMAVLRYYQTVEDDGNCYTIYEYWDNKKCIAFKKINDNETSIDDGLIPANVFEEFYNIGDSLSPNEYIHNLGDVPFIQFNNNNLQSNDLEPIKALIDTYDLCYSGFANDLEDIQEVILVLTGYGGMNEERGELVEFLKDLKSYKTVVLDGNMGNDKGDIKTLNIEIPVEAREKMLDITRKAIFDMGKGIDPQQRSFDNTSGEAMKYLYSLLELKSGLMETEFRIGLAKLVRAICRANGKEVGAIIQTWTRNEIRSNKEYAEICNQSVGVISTKTILKNHPFVEDVGSELQELAKEKEKNDIYADVLFKTNVKETTKGGELDETNGRDGDQSKPNRGTKNKTNGVTGR